MTSEHLHVKTELQVLYIALRWLLHDISTRRIHLFDVLSPVRFTLIPQNQLRSYLRDSVESIDLELEKALRVFYHKVYSKRTKTHPRLQTQKNIYIIGGFSRLQGKRWADGETLCSVEKFDTFEIQWKKMPEIEDARSGHGTAVLKQKIYVAGGERDSLICDTVECFDPTGCTWKSVACMNFPRCNLALCADRQHLYAIGGWIGSELGATIEKYDPTIDQWAVCGRVNTLRYAMGAVEHEEGRCSFIYFTWPLLLFSMNLKKRIIRIYWLYPLQRSKTLITKEVSWVWHKTASGCVVLVLEIWWMGSYSFIAITPMSTLTQCTSVRISSIG